MKKEWLEAVRTGRLWVLPCSGSFTSEYQKGTLVLVVTRGLSRKKTAAAKMILLSGLWTGLYMLCLGISCGYNLYFWGNGTVSFWLPGALCFWLFGLWVLGWLVFFSTVAETGTQVLFGTGAVAAGVYVLGLFPALGRILPTKLMGGLALLQGAEKPGDFFGSILTACLMIVFCVLASFYCFDRKKL